MQIRIVAIGFIVALASTGVAHSCSAFLATHGDGVCPDDEFVWE